ERIGRREGVQGHQLLNWLRQAERLPLVFDLSDVVEQHQAHRTGDVDQVFGVAEDALVAADDQARHQVARADAADVEAAAGVFAAQEELLENRQDRGLTESGRRAGLTVRLDELHRGAEAEGRAARLLQIRDPFGARAVELDVAPETRHLRRQRQFAPRRREDWVVDAVVLVARADLADPA